MFGPEADVVNETGVVGMLLAMGDTRLMVVGEAEDLQNVTDADRDLRGRMKALGSMVVPCAVFVG